MTPVVNEASNQYVPVNEYPQVHNEEIEKEVELENIEVENE